MLPAKSTLSGTLRAKDAPAFYEWILGRRRPSWYRRAWNWVRWGDPGGAYSHTITLSCDDRRRVEALNDLIDSDDLKGTR